MIIVLLKFLLFQDGDDGNPGQPGISLWKVKDSTSENVLIPPRISGGPYDSDQVYDVKKVMCHFHLTYNASTKLKLFFYKFYLIS